MRLFGIILLFLLFIGCNKEKLKAPEAFLIKPESITVAVSNSTLQGTTNHKITDIWYYIDGKFKGAFPITSTFPVPTSGHASITFFPGIKNNGISATRQPYEFYQALFLDTTVRPGTEVKRNFEFKYKSSVKFHWLEDFEGFGTTSGISIKKSNNTDTSFAINNSTVTPYPEVFEGTKCLYFAVDDDKRVAQFESTAKFNLPKFGAPVYLEMNYKCTDAFDVGVTNGSTTYFVAGMNATNEWNKIYIQLSSGVSTLSGDVGLYIHTLKISPGAKSEFWIDNIKILSYQ
jgi:hypothetical protein